MRSYHYQIGLQQEDRILFIDNLREFVASHALPAYQTVPLALPPDLPEFSAALYAVLDGHMGAFSAQYAADRLPFEIAALLAAPAFLLGRMGFNEVLKTAFVNTHDSMLLCPAYLPASAQHALCPGTTISLALITPSDTYFAHVGNCPIFVLMHEAKTKADDLLVLTQNPKDCWKRIVRSGMFLVNPKSQEFFLPSEAPSPREVERKLLRGQCRIGLAQLDSLGSLGDSSYDPAVFNNLVLGLRAVHKHGVQVTSSNMDAVVQHLDSLGFFVALSQHINFQAEDPTETPPVKAFIDSRHWMSQPLLTESGLQREPSVTSIPNVKIKRFLIASHGTAHANEKVRLYKALSTPSLETVLSIVQHRPSDATTDQSAIVVEPNVLPVGPGPPAPPPPAASAPIPIPVPVAVARADSPQLSSPVSVGSRGHGGGGCSPLTYSLHPSRSAAAHTLPHDSPPLSQLLAEVQSAFPAAFSVKRPRRRAGPAVMAAPLTPPSSAAVMAGPPVAPHDPVAPAAAYPSKGLSVRLPPEEPIRVLALSQPLDPTVPANPAPAGAASPPPLPPRRPSAGGAVLTPTGARAIAGVRYGPPPANGGGPALHPACTSSVSMATSGRGYDLNGGPPMAQALGPPAPQLQVSRSPPPQQQVTQPKRQVPARPSLAPQMPFNTGLSAILQRSNGGQRAGTAPPAASHMPSAPIPAPAPAPAHAAPYPPMAPPIRLPSYAEPRSLELAHPLHAGPPHDYPTPPLRYFSSRQGQPPAPPPPPPMALAPPQEEPLPFFEPPMGAIGVSPQGPEGAGAAHAPWGTEPPAPQPHLPVGTPPLQVRSGHRSRSTPLPEQHTPYSLPLQAHSITHYC